MHYYTHNIGDFASATRMLGPLEIGIAQILLDEYARTEKPLASDFIEIVSQSVASRYPAVSESLASGYVSLALRSLFEKTEAGYVCPMLDEQLKKYSERAERNRINASKPRKSKLKSLRDSETSESLASGERVASDSLTTNKPITNNQEPEVVVGEIAPMPAQPALRAAVAASPSAASPASLFPEEVSEPAPKSTSKYFPCPYEQIVRLYHEKLPMLPSIQTLTTQRKAAIKARWNQVIKEEHCQTPEEVLELFAFFFDRVAGNKFLTGGIDPSPGHSKPFRAGLDWLMKESNFVKIAENYYAR